MIFFYCKQLFFTKHPKRVQYTTLQIKYSTTPDDPRPKQDYCTSRQRGDSRIAKRLKIYCTNKINYNVGTIQPSGLNTHDIILEG